MRIGEVAAIAGITTRTVRYYHRIGLLPEPERRLNGYREYGMREAVELVRVRRLVDLGLSLDEARDALSDDAGKTLVEILGELDEDLAREERAIRSRRVALADLLKRAELPGGLGPEGPVSTELAAIFGEMARVGAERGGPEPVSAGKDRELLAMLEASAAPGHAEWFSALTAALSSDPEAVARAYEIYARFDELADAEPEDARIQALAEAMADSMPAGLERAVGVECAAGPEAAAGPEPAARPEQTAGQSHVDTFTEAFFADFPPAQQEVLRRVTELLRERGRR